MPLNTVDRWEYIGVDEISAFKAAAAIDIKPYMPSLDSTFDTEVPDPSMERE
jgi:tRNA (Thr-GGU) A37 N-methylase